MAPQGDQRGVPPVNFSHHRFELVTESGFDRVLLEGSDTATHHRVNFVFEQRDASLQLELFPSHGVGEIVRTVVGTRVNVGRFLPVLFS